MKFNNTNLDEVVKAHELHCDPNLKTRAALVYKDVEPSLADFSHMRIEGVEFCGKYLGFADFSGSIFINCNFSGAFMEYAIMKRCHFFKCKFCGTDLHASYMQHTVFDMCMFNSANLHYIDANCSRFDHCNFKKAGIDDSTDFTNVDMSCPKNMPYIPMVCPEEGEFIAWKKCYCTVKSTMTHSVYNLKTCIVKLKIPANAIRSSSFGRKCRASEAIVLAIQDIHGKDLGAGIEAFSEYDQNFKYRVGETVKPRLAPFDRDRWRECSAGIHFFINRQEAVRY